MERLCRACILDDLACAAVWHQGTPPKASVDEAKAILKKAGYEVVGGKLSYPNGKKETLTTE